MATCQFTKAEGKEISNFKFVTYFSFLIWLLWEDNLNKIADEWLISLRGQWRFSVVFLESLNRVRQQLQPFHSRHQFAYKTRVMEPSKDIAFSFTQISKIYPTLSCPTSILQIFSSKSWICYSELFSTGLSYRGMRPDEWFCSARENICSSNRNMCLGFPPLRRRIV